MLKITKVPLTFDKRKNKYSIWCPSIYIYRKKSLPGNPVEPGAPGPLIKPRLVPTNKKQTEWYMSSQYVLS